MRTKITLPCHLPWLARRRDSSGNDPHRDADSIVPASTAPAGRNYRKPIRRGCLALVTVVVTVAGGMTVAGAAPASARPASAQAVSAPLAGSGPGTYDDICLTNNDAWCVSVDPAEIYIAVISTVPAIKIIWDWINEGKGDGGQEGEEEAEGENDGGNDDAGLCLAQTDPNSITGDTGDVYMTTCGANGTVWIAYPHGDGYYLESRWWYNEGVPNEILSTGTLTSNYADDPVFVSPASSTYWRTWSWFHD